MLPAPNRLRQRADFTSAVRSSGGLRAGSRLMVVHAHPTDARAGLPPRVGFVVSRAVGGAVVRNRTKRRLRALVASRLDRLPDGLDVVVRANPRPRRRELGGTRRGPGPVGRRGAATTGRRGVRIGRVVVMPLLWLIRAYQNAHLPDAAPDLPLLPVVLRVCRDRPRALRSPAGVVDGGAPPRPVPPLERPAASTTCRCGTPPPGGPVPGTTGPRGAAGDAAGPGRTGIRTPRAAPPDHVTTVTPPRRPRSAQPVRTPWATSSPRVMAPIEWLVAWIMYGFHQALTALGMDPAGGLDLGAVDRRPRGRHARGDDPAVRQADHGVAQDADDPARAAEDPEEVQGQVRPRVSPGDDPGDDGAVQEGGHQPLQLVPADPRAVAVLLRPVPRAQRHRRASPPAPRTPIGPITQPVAAQVEQATIFGAQLSDTFLGSPTRSTSRSSRSSSSS